MKLLVTDPLWNRLQPLLLAPPQRRFRFSGGKPLDYRNILTGILFVLKTGMAWDDLPAELGCGGAGLRFRARACAVALAGHCSCIGRVEHRKWQRAGVFHWFVERSLSWLHSLGRLRRRLDRLTEIQEAFLRLACGLICLRFV